MKTEWLEILFKILMVITSPVWIPLCIVYGIIIGPIGYTVLMFQNMKENARHNARYYQHYLKEKQKGTWDNMQMNIETGKMEEVKPPSPPDKLWFGMALMLFIGLFVNIPLGVLIGPFRAINLFWRRLYFKFFPDAILREGGY